MKWNKDKMPDFDGEYLCFIVLKNECGTYTKIQRVVELKMNKWEMPKEWFVTHWQNLPDEPDLAIKPVASNQLALNIEQSPIELMRLHLKGHTFNGRPLTEYFENLIFINMNNDTLYKI